MLKRWIKKPIFWVFILILFIIGTVNDLFSDDSSNDTQSTPALVSSTTAVSIGTSSNSDVIEASDQNNEEPTNSSQDLFYDLFTTSTSLHVGDRLDYFTQYLGDNYEKISSDWTLLYENTVNLRDAGSYVEEIIIYPQQSTGKFRELTVDDYVDLSKQYLPVDAIFASKDLLGPGRLSDDPNEKTVILKYTSEGIKQRATDLYRYDKMLFERGKVAIKIIYSEDIVTTVSIAVSDWKD
ncbi:MULTISPECIES: hypothetical protein [Paenibacillus]|uniref:hypothetical protein n=1 Tax=Paenibacillus TaxID=44249 RepID=UPI0011AACABF|nr:MULTISPECIES: hypothetical protein [Paenibacillus]MBJ9989271.1 hypothetical protein [Paenibacillus sp. S28]